jgi:hypothetical protein
VRLLIGLLPLALALGCASARRPSIVIESGAVMVKGVSDSDLRAFDSLDNQRRQDVLRVWVANATADAPPLSGEVAKREQSIVFTPRYPLRPGLAYRARFDLGDAFESVVTIPAPPAQPMTRVAAVYPSEDQLPENLLKFYIHFTGPMSRGEAYQRVRLLDESGHVVPKPFLELGEELWNPKMTRFTLFFEPGRIKTGLVPRREMGLALARGQTYTLVVDENWQDEHGRPLVETFKKTFRVTEPDTRQPDPARWQITAPASGSTDALVVRFDEPLDHAMLEHVITVRDVQGTVAVSNHEKQWAFTPTHPWKAGRHVLVVETILEDAAGNSIGRPFEVDLNAPLKPAAPPTVEIRFDVK